MAASDSTARVDVPVTRPRPIVAPTFGSLLRSLRTQCGHSQTKVCDLLGQKNINITQSTLAQYEAGAIASPDPVALLELASIYQSSQDEIVAALARDRGAAIGSQHSEPAHMATLKELLEEAARRFGNQANAARAIGVHPSRFSTVLQSQGTPAVQSFELATCLRLAKALGRPASDVLDAAGKLDDHALIAELYGGERPASDLSHEERQLLALVRQEDGAGDGTPLEALEASRSAHALLDSILMTSAKRKAKLREAAPNG